MPSGFCSSFCSRSVLSPSTGVPSTVAAMATPSPTSGTTRSVRFCVSRGSDTSPAMLTKAEGPAISKSLVSSTPRASFTSPAMRSKAKPSLKMSRKSKVTRRGSDCSDSRPSSLPAPASIFANCPREASTLKRPESTPAANS